MRCNLRQSVLGCVVIWLTLGHLSAQPPEGETAPQNTTVGGVDLSTLSAEQKQELVRRKEQFEQLSPTEQERLRKLHAELATHPAASQLTAVMSRYHDWLQTLTPLERDELLSLPPDERLERIKRLQRQQQQERFEQLAEKVPPEDMEVILKWLENFAVRHESQILAGIPPEFRQRFDHVEEPERRRRMLLMAMNFRASSSEPIVPQREDLQQLLPQLSKPSQDKLSQSKEPVELVKSWVKVAAISRMMPPPTEEQLMEFFRSLPAKDRSELEGLPPDAMRAAVTKKYYQVRMGKMKENFRPSFLGGDRPPFGRPAGGTPNDPRRPFKGGPPGERPPPGERLPGERPPPRDNRPPPENGPRKD